MYQQRWLALGIERWILGAADFPFRLGNVGEAVYLDGFNLTFTGAPRADCNPNLAAIRQALCTLYNPTLQWGTPTMGAVLRPAAPGENFGVHNGLHEINLKQHGLNHMTPVFCPVRCEPPILIPAGELRMNTVLETDTFSGFSTDDKEALDLEIQGTFFFHVG